MKPRRLEAINQTFKLRDTGFLTCDACAGSQDCHHIVRLIKEDADVPLYWDRPGEPPHFDMFVPIMPSAGVFVFYGFEWIPNLWAYELRPDVTKFSSMPPIGYLNEGEGLSSIRSSFHDWFLSSEEMNNRCTGESHGYTAEMVWQANGRLPSSDLKQHLEVWMFSKCAYCLAGSVSSGDAYNAAIPDDDSKSNSPWRR